MEKSQGKNKTPYLGDDLSAKYYLNRPTYPASLYETILSYLTNDEGDAHLQGPGCNLAVDVACGSGQATGPLAKHFKKVIGCDLSQTQIHEAIRQNKSDNIEYRVAPAEDLAFISDGSVDLVTCGTAFHYMEPELLCQEVKRVLRPNGTFAMFVYGPPILPTPEARQAFDKYLSYFYDDPVELDALFNGYKNVNIALGDVTRRDDLTIDWSITLSSFIAYLTTWSLYWEFVEEHPDTQILQTLKDRLVSPLSTDAEDDPLLDITFTLYLLMGRNTPL